ncbi:unnamed protein product [Rotaria sordida]|uniref:Uncharacterized protein n=1 Tax=Rotaria sordida TaxID=392033 RepID=A0A815RMG6_9BILA|nr:unnamed protein product [Rotaria sordida]CAF1479814.1 unnamed protein product [Rotaria sordida]CAF4068580.1 unnamed protein product [Rotaria sordida]
MKNSLTYSSCLDGPTCLKLPQLFTGLVYRSSTSTSYLLDWKNKTIAELTILNSNSSTTNVIYSQIQIVLFKQHINSLLIYDNNTLLIIDSRTGDLIN